MIQPLEAKYTGLPTAKTKTILFLDHTASLGGGEIALLNLVLHMDHEQFRPVVALSSDGALRLRLHEAGIETHIVPLATGIVDTRKDTLGARSLLRTGTIGDSLTYVARLARFMRRRDVDLVHTNSLKADILGGLAARLAGIPVVWHVRDRIEPDYLPAPVVTVFRWLARHIPAYVIANSNSTLSTLHLPKTRNSLAIYSGVVNQRSRVVHDGIQATGNLCDDRKSTGTATSPLVGIVGRLSSWKGQHIFIEAAATVRKQFPHARFQIIGSAMFGEEAYEAQIRGQAAALALNDCLEFTGFRADVPHLIQGLTMLVHASTTGEPFGQVVIEGMCASKPVIATNGGGVPEIVLDGVTGVLVPMNDAPALAAAILRLLDDPAAAHAMGAAGYQRVQEAFTIEHTVAKVESVYWDILSQQTVRRRDPARASA